VAAPGISIRGSPSRSPSSSRNCANTLLACPPDRRAGAADGGGDAGSTREIPLLRAAVAGPQARGTTAHGDESGFGRIFVEKGLHSGPVMPVDLANRGIQRRRR
jgi:hypothetical protein